MCTDLHCVPALQHLSDTYFGVRVKCLQLLGCVGSDDHSAAAKQDGGCTAAHSCVVTDAMTDTMTDTKTKTMQIINIKKKN